LNAPPRTASDPAAQTVLTELLWLAATNQYFAPHLIRLRGFFCLMFAAVATPTIERSPGIV